MALFVEQKTVLVDILVPSQRCSDLISHMWKVSEERVAFPGCTPPRYLYIRFIKYIRTTKRALKYIHFYLSYIYMIFMMNDGIHRRVFLP